MCRPESHRGQLFYGRGGLTLFPWFEGGIRASGLRKDCGMVKGPRFSSPRGVTFHVPLETAKTPSTGACLANRWWAVHPDEGVAFWCQPTGFGRSDSPSPQCHDDEASARRLFAELHPDHEVVQIEVVFLAHAERAMVRVRADHPVSMRRVI
jgi:hypothetical protein